MEENRLMFHYITFHSPFLRINNRNQNIAFYEKNLGLKVSHEENAMVFLTGWENKENQIIIEESPSMRTRRAVNDVKKLKRLILKAKAKEIESLLARGVSADKIYQGKNGYAYEVTSLEGDVILLHAEDDLTNLVEITQASYDSLPNFKGLSDFEVETIQLNVLSKDTESFYSELMSDGFPPILEFFEAEGQDLLAEPNEIWDLEILEFKVPLDYQLANLRDYFEAKSCQVYLDRKESLLVVSDPSKIELWFSK